MRSGKPVSTPSSYLDSLRAWYLQERNATIESEKGQSDLFDKSILTLSSGALALSLGLFSAKSGSQTPNITEAIVISWICYGSSILSTLLSFKASIGAYRRERASIDKQYRQEAGEAMDQQADADQAQDLQTVQRKAGRWGLITALNVVSVVSFVLGTVTFAWFLIGNLR
jgi:hypothetical protein